MVIRRITQAILRTGRQPVWRWLLTFKLSYWAIIFISVWCWGAFDTNQFNAVTVHWPREGGPNLASHFATWDAAHYLLLSEVGYQEQAVSCAFYPLWPLVVGAFSFFTGGSHLLAGLILANLLSLAGFALFYKMAQESHSAQAARLSLVLLLTFPGALFYQFHYTEAMFFLLVMLLWHSLEGRRYLLACVPAFLLPMTRAIGLFCFFPIAWHLLKRKLAEPDPGAALPPGRQNPNLRQTNESRTAFGRAAWLALLAPVAGWCCYLAFMKAATGNAFEGFEAQKHWGVHSIRNLADLPHFVLGFFNPTAWHAFTGSVLDRCLFILLLCCIPTLWKIGGGLCVWAWVLGILPAMSGTFTSYTRFQCVAFPMFIALGVVLSQPENRFLRWSLLAVFLVLHAILVWRFVNYRWAG